MLFNIGKMYNLTTNLIYKARQYNEQPIVKLAPERSATVTDQLSTVIGTPTF